MIIRKGNKFMSISIAGPKSLLVALAGSFAALAASAQQSVQPDNFPAPAAAASWPHTINRDGASITVYEPQAISWPERHTRTARAAVGIGRPGQTKPLLGTIEMTLATRVDDAAGVV